MPTYEELKTELLEISKIVEKFPEQIKSQVYELLIQQYLGKPIQNQSLNVTSTEKLPKTSEKITAPRTEQEEPKRVKRRSTKESYSIDRHVNLRGDGNNLPSFKTFHSTKNPKSAKEFNAVAVYYLKKKLSVANVTLDQVYTCYDEVSRKPPQAFRQSFIDTKNKEGWVEFDVSGNLDIPHRGITFVEYDLPKTEAKKTKE